eukprot:scaffold10794_cov66-Phaeocystis_antarctica.AAC.8
MAQLGVGPRRVGERLLGKAARVYRRLQPCEPQAATVCVPGCKQPYSSACSVKRSSPRASAACAIASSSSGAGWPAVA